MGTNLIFTAHELLHAAVLLKSITRWADIQMNLMSHLTISYFASFQHSIFTCAEVQHRVEMSKLVIFVYMWPLHR